LQEKRHALAESEAKSADNLAVLQAAIAEVEAGIADARGKQGYTVSAPVSSRINRLQAWSGMSVETGIPFMSIIPENTYLGVSLLVPVRDIGFVARGQTVHFGVALELTPTQEFSRTSERSRLRLRDILIWPRLPDRGTYRQVSRPPRLPGVHTPNRNFSALGMLTIDVYYELDPELRE
jgi:hypothetical protein